MTAPTIHIRRQVAPDGPPPFAPGTTVRLTYQVTCDAPVRIDRIEQSLPEGWGCHPDARKLGLDHVGDTLTRSPQQIMQPGNPTTFTIPVMLNSFEGTAELPPLLVAATTRDQQPVHVAPIGALPAPPVAKVQLGLAARTLGHGQAQIAVRNGSDAPLTDVRITVVGGRFDASPSGDSTWTLEEVPAGSTPILDVVVTDPQNLVATIVSARTTRGVELPDALLPAPANASVPPQQIPEPAPTRTIYTPDTLTYQPMEQLSDVMAPEPSQFAPPSRHSSASHDQDEDELTPTAASDLSAAGGKVDVTRVVCADESKHLSVGDIVEVRAMVTNGTDEPQHNVTLVADLPRFVTVRDNDWTVEDGRGERPVPYLPPGNEVFVPLKVRVDKAGDLTVRFEVIDDNG